MTLTYTDAFAMTRPDVEVNIETPLDPIFAKELVLMANHYAEAQSQSDDAQWSIARMTYRNWSEHQNLCYPVVKGEQPKKIFPTVMEYYAECSRLANLAWKVKMFGESGETLKRWVQGYAYYDNDPKALDYLEKTSFNHMWKAARLYKKQKVKSTHEALNWAMKVDPGEKVKSADDMEYHFDPPTMPDEYDVMIGRIDVLQSEESWKPLKSKESKKQVLAHVAEIRKIVESEFPKVTK